jgi:hypothetical protein
VIDYAVKALYGLFKKQRLLWKLKNLLNYI